MPTANVPLNVADLVAHFVHRLDAGDRQALVDGLRSVLDHIETGYERVELAKALIGLEEFPFEVAVTLADTDDDLLRGLASRPDLRGEAAATVLRLTKGLRRRREAAHKARSVEFADLLFDTADVKTRLALLHNVNLPSPWRAAQFVTVVNGPSLGYNEAGEAVKALCQMREIDALDAVGQIQDPLWMLHAMNADGMFLQEDAAERLAQLVVDRVDDIVAFAAANGRAPAWGLLHVLDRIGRGAPARARARVVQALSGRVPGLTDEKLTVILQPEVPASSLTWEAVLANAVPKERCAEVLRELATGLGSDPRAWQLLFTSGGTMTGPVDDVVRAIAAAVKD